MECRTGHAAVANSEVTIEVLRMRQILTGSMTVAVAQEEQNATQQLPVEEGRS